MGEEWVSMFASYFEEKHSSYKIINAELNKQNKSYKPAASPQTRLYRPG